MKYQTSVDTVCLQIDTPNEMTRSLIVDGIFHLLWTKKIYFAEKPCPASLHSNFYKKEYYLYSNNLVLATIWMSSFSMKNNFNNTVNTTYYIALEFAGLKSHHPQRDAISNTALFSVCAYLNTRSISFKLKSLDVCLDMYTSMDNVLALCTKKSPKTIYYGANEAQKFHGTYYIEKINIHPHEAVQRAYLYDKALKDKLPYRLTRFELKLQSKFFSKYRHTFIASMIKSLSRYHVMHVPNKRDKNYLMEQYDQYPILRDRDIKRIGFDTYRCYPDIAAVVNFINQLFSIKEMD